MCGIVGILGRAPVADQIVDSLKGDHLERRRAEGKLKNLEARLRAEPLAGHTGLGHTRWATHGKPTENNAHPHATDRVAFALGFIFASDDNLMIGARNGPPLAIGYGDGEMYLGSDAIALGPFTDTVAYLEDGDWVVLTRNSAVIYDKNNAIVHRDAIKHTAATS